MGILFSVFWGDGFTPRACRESSSVRKGPELVSLAFTHVQLPWSPFPPTGCLARWAPGFLHL